MAASATSAAIAARRRSWLTLQTSMTWGGRGWRRWDTRADYVDASVPRVRRIIGDHRPLDSPGCAVVRRHFEYVGILRGIAASPQATGKIDPTLCGGDQVFFGYEQPVLNDLAENRRFR